MDAVVAAMGPNDREPRCWHKIDRVRELHGMLGPSLRSNREAIVRQTWINTLHVSLLLGQPIVLSHVNTYRPHLCFPRFAPVAAHGRPTLSPALTGLLRCRHCSNKLASEQNINMGRASSINPHEPEALPVSSPSSLGPYPTAALLVSLHSPAN